jgi:putative SOS response-associated peptidase YedK
MCNLYTQTRSVDEVARIFRDLQIPLVFPDGAPNLAPRDIAITDPGPIVRLGCTPAKAGAQSETNNTYELVVRRWSWPGPGGKPVYNFRSDGREFSSGRCLIVADGFYEFTPPADPKQKRKDRWLFTLPDGGPLGIAGLVRTVADLGEAFTMLTCPPGPDVAPTHDRQVAVLERTEWKAWLDYSAPASSLIKTLPGGSLNRRPAPR